MTRHRPEGVAPTQVTYPGRATVRTFLQTWLPALALLVLAVPPVIGIIDEEAGAYLPDNFRGILAGIATACAVLAAIAARVMALAPVVAFLERSRLLGWLAPAPVPPEPPTSPTDDDGYGPTGYVPGV